MVKNDDFRALSRSELVAAVVERRSVIDGLETERLAITALINSSSSAAATTTSSTKANSPSNTLHQRGPPIAA